ncbi:MAG TPA: hypothetical protein VMM93_14310 [Vicinamibacterales bacterium]|nr:hypothetical protein [Vicinamibacterales bacterium]
MNLEAVEGAFGADIDYAMLVQLYGQDPENERRYTRLSNGFSRKIENHMAAVALNYFACRRWRYDSIGRAVRPELDRLDLTGVRLVHFGLTPLNPGGHAECPSAWRRRLTETASSGRQNDSHSSEDDASTTTSQPAIRRVFHRRKAAG